MTEIAELKAGVVGTGFIGVVHVDALRRLGVEVLGVAGSTPERAAAKGIAPVYESYEAMLADDRVDVVHLTTPNHLHHPQAEQALAAGKHVVCEKPLAVTSEQSSELVELAEGSGLVVLEEREHAMKRGATIIAEIIGYGATSDAYHLTQPAPQGEGAQRAMKLALRDAKVDLERVSYVNAHATSTPIGDKQELQALKGVFGARALGQKNKDGVWISATKSVTGHLLGAAGGRVRHANRDFGLLRGAAQSEQRAIGVGESEPGVLDECRGPVRQPRPSCVPLEEPDAELVLQVGDLSGQGLLCDM